MIKYLIPILISGLITASEIDNDIKFQNIAHKFLSENSKKENDIRWVKKIRDSVNQKISDSPHLNENSCLNQMVLDWAAPKDFRNLSINDKIEAARFYLVYRDPNFSPFDVLQLQLPGKIIERLKNDKIDEWLK